MVLMTTGNELDPVFDFLAFVIAVRHALWDGWMPLAGRSAQSWRL